MSKEDQNKYLASLKEYRDWYAVLSTAENKGIQKGLEEAEKKIKKALKEKEKAQKEKEKAQKREEKAQREKENAQKEREEERKEKEKAQKEKENAKKREEKVLKASINKFLAMNLSISDIAETLGVSEDVIKDLSK